MPKPKRAIAGSILASAIGLVLFVPVSPLDVLAAELTVEDGVVIKFGAGAQMVVRDRWIPRKGITLTSQKDDTTGGQTGAAPQTAAAGDWRGVRIEKSAAGYGALTIDDVTVRYAGALDGSDATAALTLRAWNPALQNLQLTDNSVGLRLLDGANPAIGGASFLRNATGIEAAGNSTATIGNSQFVGNALLAINNQTPASIIQATGNWWGHNTGPREATANPQGLGDAVSTGVDFGSYLTAAPLLNPTVRLAVPAAYFEQRTVSLDVACLNATEYRIAEGNAFTSEPFQPLTNGRGQISFTTSAGDGRKNIVAEFRNASGISATASLTGGLLLDTEAPAVTLINPLPGSVITQLTTIEASASDSAGISQIQVYLDDVLVGTLNTPPYSYSWNSNATPGGAHTIKVVATDEAGRSSAKSAVVTVLHLVDTQGPLLSDVSVNGVALADGAGFTRSGSLTLSATDQSGVARIDVLLDGSVVATAAGSGNYTVLLNLDGVANGAHALALRAEDSLGNVSTNTYSITVAHAAPEAPIFSQPVNGLTTRTASLPVSGSAAAGSTVQLLLNGQPAGSAVSASSEGHFNGSVTLVSGANQIQATAADQYGTSTASSPVLATLDVTVPSSPNSLIGTAQAAGNIRLGWTRSTDVNTVGYDIYRAANVFTATNEAVKINGTPVTATTYDDMPPQDTTWFYRVVAVNNAGTASLPSNLVQATSDATAPKALSIVYTPLGKTDPVTGRVGQGRVNLVLTTSEPLQALPYLSVVPQGGMPIPVALTRTDNTTYNGGFVIDANTPSGTANALFSARDAVGNRGTAIDSGATLTIDAEGPRLTNIVVSPASPIKNDPAQTVQATFSFSEAPSVVPQVKYLLSRSGSTSGTPVVLSQIEPTKYTASFTLPTGSGSGSGSGSPETLRFSFTAQDDLDNFSTKVSALNSFQVYQGGLPPLEVPFAFSAKAQPAGKVKLGWQAVEGASSYQLYRQAPTQPALQELIRTTGIEYIDQTPQDGAYKYAVASVRQANGQESVSGQTASLDIIASATAPGVPQSLRLALDGQGVLASWQAPLASNVAYYNLYRADGASITSITGLTPLKTNIKSASAYDTNPLSTQAAYVVTAVDAAGNESAMSNSVAQSPSLFPVRNLKVEQIANELPSITWDAPSGNIAGYLVYLGPEASKLKLTESPIISTSYIDTGYTGGERRYSIATVDAGSQEMPHSIVLPNVTAQVVSGLPIKRGIMNKLQVQVTNTSATALNGVRVVVRLPINQQATQFKDHKSEVLALAANQTLLVPVIVGGYAELPGAPTAQVGVEITPNEGELVKIARNQAVDVTEGAIVIGMATDEFTRGATGKVKLTVENTSEVDAELLVATNGGAGDSSELRFKMLDGDSNLLATQAYKQAFGADVVQLTNGQTVARIPAGARYVSDVFNVAIPASSPNSVRLKLEVDKLRYHTGQDDEVQIAGRGAEKIVSLIDTAYVGEVTDASPINSFGDQDIVVTGRALDRASKAPLPNTRLKLVFNQQGFERIFSVLTDASGSFVYTFKPTITDAGLYKVSAVHPDVTDRPEQKAFVINRVTVGPTPYKVDIPKNYPFTISFMAKAGPGTAATNLRLTLDAASQPTGQLPAGIHVQLPAAVTMAERQTLNVPVMFTADNDAQPSGSLLLNVISDEHAGAPIGVVKVDYTLTEAKPYLISTPSFMETGMTKGGSQVESVVIKNNGAQDAYNLQFTLDPLAPSWVNIASQANGTLAVGESRTVDLAFIPPAGTSDGDYAFKLLVAGDNVPSQTINVYARVTQSGHGNILFKAQDIYTATVDKDGQLIQGLAGASITIQNEDVPSITQELLTDALGEAQFNNMPAGRYKYRAKASNHQEVGGRLFVKPGLTVNQPVFLDYSLVTIEWSVREITIQDVYEITLNATYFTDVPAPVVLLQPVSTTLPKMAVGAVYNGELTLTNYGLIRADNVKQFLPKSDAYFRFEFLVDVPTTLNAKQRVTLPYRIVALQSLDDAASSGTASGGGSAGYSNSTSVGFEYSTGCGVRPGEAAAMWFSPGSNSSGGGGSGGGGWGGWGGGGGGVWGGGSAIGGSADGGRSTPVDLGGGCSRMPNGALNGNGGSGGSGGADGAQCPAR